MAIRKIAKMGHPVLRQIAKPVPRETILSPEIQNLIDDLLETCLEADGAGLAAPQIHESLRIVTLRVEEDEELSVWINPRLEATTDQHMLTFEGCLSIPELRGAVARPNEITVKGFDRKGSPFERRLEGFSAVVAQHECDHLDGILFIDRAESKTLSFLNEYRKYGESLMELILEGEE